MKRQSDGPWPSHSSDAVGNIDIAVEKGSIRMKETTGVLWRIRRTGTVQVDLQSRFLTLPMYLIRLLSFLLAGTGLVLGLSALLRRRK